MGPIVSVVPLRQKWKFGHVPRVNRDTSNAGRNAVSSVMGEDNIEFHNHSQMDNLQEVKVDNESLAKVM